MDDSPLQNLIRTLSKIPGLGPRSAQRAVLFLLKEDGARLNQLIQDASRVQKTIQRCAVCGNLDYCSPCGICVDARRNKKQLCIVEKISDLWAIEQAHFFRGHYHILGGLLSAIDGVGPGQLNTEALLQRVHADQVQEIIIALSATIEGQTTTFFLSDLLSSFSVQVSTLAQGVPFGGELNYLDEGTLSAAFSDRRIIPSSSQVA